MEPAISVVFLWCDRQCLLCGRNWHLVCLIVWVTPAFALSADWQQIKTVADPILPQTETRRCCRSMQLRAAGPTEHRTAISLFPLWNCSLLFIVPALSERVSWRSVAARDLQWDLTNKVRRGTKWHDGRNVSASGDVRAACHVSIFRRFLPN